MSRKPYMNPKEQKGNDKKKKGSFPPLNKGSKTIVIWFLIILFVLFAVQLLNRQREKEVPVSYTKFKEEVNKDNVRRVIIIEKEIKGELVNESVLVEGATAKNFTHFKTYIPFEDPELTNILEEKNVEIISRPASVKWTSILLSGLPMLLFIAFWLFIMRQMQVGGNRAFSFGKSRARLLTENKPKVTFRDVAGIDEAKEEVQEIIEFLKDPKKFQKLGGKIPKGALLLGPPGTGKTLLARAIAGEAGVAFFSMSGSDFVEMFVGVGASRVRDLFEQGKRNAPCIIFIDEIDAVGRHRGAGLGGGHDEREQTLNQLLVEMDGFESNEGVILIAATNRPDVLDPALLRPGRFDRTIVIDRPDIRGRQGILQVHTRKIPLKEDVDLSVLARGTPGFSGADLANLVNEAALLAARYSQNKVSQENFEDAKDRVMMGAERRSLIIKEDEKKTTAYHEAGHALVSSLLPGADPVHKVTIIPRGRSLGVTQTLPVDDRHNYSQSYFQNLLIIYLGGRAAEQLVFSQLTSGAGDDIERATNLARKMVCEWGMSETLGPLTFGKKDEEIFLGREFARQKDYSEQTAREIDQEIRRFVEEAHTHATMLIKDNIDKLHLIANSLLERETLDSTEIEKLISGLPLKPLKSAKKKQRTRRVKKKPEKKKTAAEKTVQKKRKPTQKGDENLEKAVPS
jgi:cell division protease FtsH